MKRGEREKQALDMIKRLLFCDKLQQPLMRLDKSVYDFSDEEYKEVIYCCTNTVDKSIYGLSQNDFYEITNAIRKAVENSKPSDFPDFVLDNGFIEHFQITASKENKDGSKEMADQAKFKRDTKKEREQFYKYCEENPCFNHTRSISWTRKNLPEYSYENLEKSFKANLEKHLNSLEKYEGNKDLSVFLIENSEVNLEMCENTFDDVKEGIRCDYPKRQEHFWKYVLSRDKNMLKYIYQFKDKIDYIIYYYHENFEIIKVENIPELLKYIPNDFIIEPRYIQIIHKISNISIKYP